MKVKFLPEGQEFEIKSNQTVLNLAQEHGLHIQSVCKGIPSCSECRVTIAEGENNVLPPSSTELTLIGSAYFVDQRRLSCQLRCFGDVTIDLSGQIEKATEAVSSKRPRGYGAKKEAGESQAVMGNIIHESRTDVNERTANLSLEEEETRRELERIKSLKAQSKSGGGSSRPSDENKQQPSREGNRGRQRQRQNRNKK